MNPPPSRIIVPDPTFLSRALMPLLALLATLIPLHAQTGGGTLVIDDFTYANSTTARAAWLGTGGPYVTMSTNGAWGAQQVMLLTCDFATRSSRCYWDRTVALNLASRPEFDLDVYAGNPAAISSFTLYFKSGSGWYGAAAAIKQQGWQTLRFALGDFTPEGTPSGWDKIDGIRLSPWKGAPVNTYLAVSQLRAYTPAVLLIRDTQTTNPEIVQQTIDRHLTWLGGYNISCGVISRAGLESGLARGSRILILPYNETLTEAEMVQLESFVATGGRLMVYYLLPSRLPALLGVRPTGWTAGDFAAWRFADPNIPALPPRVLQASWNITTAVPDGTLGTRITAKWENSLGQDTGKAAWLTGEHGFFMSHVLLGDDAYQKSYSLLCLVGTVLPEVWPMAAAGEIGQIGKVGPYLTYEQAVDAIRLLAAPTLRAPLVEGELTAARNAQSAAASALVASNYSQAIFSAQEARSRLRQAYSLCLKPVTPEFRALWEHHATGPFPGNWTAAISALATNQITAVFPNMLWGGLAHYDSAFLPHSDDFNQYGDQITACVNAAHARGIQVHVWKVNWNLEGAPPSFINAMRAASRTQVSSSGTNINWLCPSHPDNLALETNSMLEVVRNYDVDGIHFDYIRYPDSSSCYCSGCRARFQAQTGRTVTNWPADVLATGTLRTAFLDWRRDQITRLVSAVHAGARAIKPGVKISAAVFPDAASAYDEVGQDWRRWVTNGIVDFLCPMDYTTDLSGFTNLVTQQLGFVNGRVPIYPGIGAFIQETDATLSQVQATRSLKAGGFTLFELSPGSASALLPALGRGATAPDEPDTDNDLLPDSWELRWFPNLTVAGLDSDQDADGLIDRDEYTAGTDPTHPTPGLSLQIRFLQGQIEISFPARAVEGAGYQNASRHYRLETSTNLSPSASWEAVSGFADLTATSGVQTQKCSLAPTSGAARLYRLRVWLQQKS